MEAWRQHQATKEAFRRLQGKIDSIVENIRLRVYIDPDNADKTQYGMGVATGKMEGLQEALNIGRE